MAVNVGKMLTRVFGSRNERLLKRYRRVVVQVNDLEGKIAAMSDEQLRQRTRELHLGLMNRKLSRNAVLPEAMAIMRESMDRHIGIRAIFDPEGGFDPAKLSGEARAAFDAVQRRMISSGEGWQRVPIPMSIYAAVRELYPESRPPFRARCFDVQIIGGLVLYEGKIAEMATGEGKTFVAPLACYMRVLEGFHCHVVTVNDYLVRRDAAWVRPAFENLGISVGFIQVEMEPGGEMRRKQYACDITYGTNSEFGFDYLRDNMKERVESQVQGPLDFAIVDEVDSILIDEARTPLIISGFAHDDAPKYRAADTVARKVVELNKSWDSCDAAVDAAKRGIKAAEGDEDKAKGDKKAIAAARQRRADAEKALAESEQRKTGLTQYYEVELDKKSVHLTHEGVAAAQDAAGVGSFYVGNNMEWPHLMEQALRAHVVYVRDKDYLVGRGPKGEMEVTIVDEFTGRAMVGRQWSDGLHQAVEAKERVPIKAETQTLATITLQNFCKLYKSLAGMTGTAQTEAEEFNKIYNLEVVTIPTNRQCIRDDGNDRVYRTEPEKWTAILEDIKEASDSGCPVLVGTTSVEKSEMLSKMLQRNHGIEHEVLNAKQHEREALIIAKAGQQHRNAHSEMVGNVTIATNMAGRGTDIKLSPECATSGGLHVVGTERHTARRIDNQLRGRSARQGDPGSSRFFVSLQDELMKAFAGEWAIKVLGFLGMEEGMAIEDKRISKGILRAQKKVEERNFLARKNLLEYDEVMDQHRTTFYGMRQRVLEGRGVEDVIWRMIGEAISDAVEKYVMQDYVAATIAEWSSTNFHLNFEARDLHGMRKIDDLEAYIKEQARAEAQTNIASSLGEYMGEDRTDPKQWDTRGLSAWAMSRFQVNLPQNRIRQTPADELEALLSEAAVEQIQKRDCSGLMKFLEKDWALNEMRNWARDKFSIEVKLEELTSDGSNILPAADIVKLVEERARTVYAQRELTCWPDLAITSAFADATTADNPFGAERIREWVAKRFGVQWTLEQIRAMKLDDLHRELVALQRKFLRDGGAEAEVDALMAAHPDLANPAPLIAAANTRFAADIWPEDFWPAPDGSGNGEVARHSAKPATNGHAAAQAGSAAPNAAPDLHPDGDVLHAVNAPDAMVGEGPADPKLVRQVLIDSARRFFRRELTELEQFVLIQIFDQSWKDHLFAMDILKGGIGLQGFAERDPRIAYKKEGFRYFKEMLAGVRDKVTDLVFRARISTAATAPRRSIYRETAAVHDTQQEYGVSENLRRDQEAGIPIGPPPGVGGNGGEMQAASNQSQGEGARVKTIVREAPKVGRNDPCPCGSGKKYKKCCGVNAA
jgi:preprotein translocase subunit SecA